MSSRARFTAGCTVPPSPIAEPRCLHSASPLIVAVHVGLHLVCSVTCHAHSLLCSAPAPRPFSESSAEYQSPARLKHTISCRSSTRFCSNSSHYPSSCLPPSSSILHGCLYKFNAEDLETSTRRIPSESSLSLSWSSTPSYSGYMLCGVHRKAGHSSLTSLGCVSRSSTIACNVPLTMSYLAYVPSRLQLVSLDLCILVLQLLVTTISYETQLYYTSTETEMPDALLPEASPLSTPSNEHPPLAATSRLLSPSDPDTPQTNVAKDSKRNPTPCIVDLQLSPIISRLRNPAPPVTARSDSLLPLPNTTSLPIPAGLRMIMRANARARRDRGAGGDGGNTQRGAGSGGNESGGRIPGGLG